VGGPAKIAGGENRGLCFVGLACQFTSSSMLVGGSDGTPGTS
jgi:hypothetical protein